MLPRAVPGFAFVLCNTVRKVVVCALLPFCALLLPVTPALAAPQVAASIKPLQLIAAAVTDGVTSPSVIWGQGQDPHHVAFARRSAGSWAAPMSCSG
jgi:ABC-type Zn2+ transport system substrate-binding protein/surface adhesin